MDGGVSGEREVSAQVCAVHRPLMSVTRLCRAGHRVVFDDEGSYIENKVSLERLKIDEVDGEYVMDMWVRTGGSGGSDGNATFGGQRK